MTSRGSLAYYLAAWVCGCFFMAVGFWISLHIFRGPSSQVTFQNVSLLGFAFFGLIWLWIAAGALVAISLIWCLGSLGQLARDPRYLPYSALPIWPFLLVGPLAMMEGSLWMTLPVGALTAAVLFAVYRAFEQQAES
jgi:hypothetical protein